jgi:hypothetical protein
MASRWPLSAGHLISQCQACFKSSLGAPPAAPCSLLAASTAAAKPRHKRPWGYWG